MYFQRTCQSYTERQSNTSIAAERIQAQGVGGTYCTVSLAFIDICQLMKNNLYSPIIVNSSYMV